MTRNQARGEVFLESPAHCAEWDGRHHLLVDRDGVGHRRVLHRVLRPGGQEASGYLFARPLDTFSAAWTAVVEAYKALLTGMLFDPAKLSSEGLVKGAETSPRPSRWRPLLILGGLAVALAFRAGPVQHRC